MTKTLSPYLTHLNKNSNREKRRKKMQSMEEELSISLRSFNQCLTRDENFRVFPLLHFFFLIKSNFATRQIFKLS